MAQSWGIYIYLISIYGMAPNGKFSEISEISLLKGNNKKLTVLLTEYRPVRIWRLSFCKGNT